ncbi:hypothetical protein BGW39_007763 [Mortierella sp. 14UC]|nr:hypothetical protein BGW39_007763 [Mortierella sp. 14UC]
MAPKRSSADSTTPAPATNFFTRGAKPTTTQRIVNAKKASFTPTPAAVPNKVQHRNEDEDEEDEVSDEIEQVDTDEDVQLHTPRQQEQQLSLGRQEADQDEDQDEYDSLHEEIEQTDEDQDDSDAPSMVRPTRATAAKTTTGLKKAAVTKPAAAAKVTKPTLPTRSTAAATKNNKNKDPAPYVAPDVGDIHRGFHQSELSDNEKMLRQFDLASRYGPCTDITRLERWERAFTLPQCIWQAQLVRPAVALLVIAHSM